MVLIYIPFYCIKVIFIYVDNYVMRSCSKKYIKDDGISRSWRAYIRPFSIFRKKNCNGETKRNFDKAGSGIRYGK